MFPFSSLHIYINIRTFSSSSSTSFFIALNFFLYYNILTTLVVAHSLKTFKIPHGRDTSNSSTTFTGGDVSSSRERQEVLKKLARLDGPRVSVVNEVDDSSPPLSFEFVNDSVLGKDVEKADEGFMSGCDCRVENGRNCGCEYRSCACLQQSDRDEAGNVHFPYAASQRNRGCLRKVYLETRNHIYECNSQCNCLANCKNKLVQHGRQVPLEIFKTSNRGWGKICSRSILPSTNSIP